MLWSCPPLFGWGRYIPEGFQTSCSFDYLSRDPATMSHVWCMFSMGFLIPVFVSATCYVLIIRAVSKQRKSMAKTSKKMNATEKDKKNHKQEIELAKVAGGTVVLFILAWLPYATVALFGITGNSGWVTPYTCQLPVMFAKASALWNPFLYAFTHPRFKAVIKTRFPCLMCCCRTGHTENATPATGRDEHTEESSEMSISEVETERSTVNRNPTSQVRPKRPGAQRQSVQKQSDRQPSVVIRNQLQRQRQSGQSQNGERQRSQRQSEQQQIDDKRTGHTSEESSISNRNELQHQQAYENPAFEAGSQLHVIGTQHFAMGTYAGPLIPAYYLPSPSTGHQYPYPPPGYPYYPRYPLPKRRRSESAKDEFYDFSDSAENQIMHRSEVEVQHKKEAKVESAATPVSIEPTNQSSDSPVSNANNNACPESQNSHPGKETTVNESQYTQSENSVNESQCTQSGEDATVNESQCTQSENSVNESQCTQSGEDTTVNESQCAQSGEGTNVKDKPESAEAKVKGIPGSQHAQVNNAQTSTRKQASITIQNESENIISSGPGDRPAEIPRKIQASDAVALSLSESQDSTDDSAIAMETFNAVIRKLEEAVESKDIGQATKDDKTMEWQPIIDYEEGCV